jgi:hypothetical protein
VCIIVNWSRTNNNTPYFKWKHLKTDIIEAGTKAIAMAFIIEPLYIGMQEMYNGFQF